MRALSALCIGGKSNNSNEEDILSIKLTLLDAGYCIQSEHWVLRGGRRKPIRFPATFALLEHSEFGPILFDTGYAPRFFEATRRFPYSLYAKATPVYLDEHETALRKLQARGIAPTDIQYVLISHFHADHIAGIADFPRARYIYLQAAFEAVQHRRGLRAVLAGFLPGLMPAGFQERSQPLDPGQMQRLPSAYTPFTDGLDLLGDQSIWAVPLPGHAEGHMGLFLQANGQECYFLAVDACWHSRAYREYILPHPLTRLICSDWAAYRETLAKVHHFHRRRPEVHIILSHCPEVYERYI